MPHYLNGEWVEDKDFKISALDILIIRGYGIFDLIRTYGGKPFMVDHHIDRFFTSAKIMDLPLPHIKTELEQIITEGITKNGFEETSIRLVLTGGISDNLITAGTPSFFIIFKPLKTHAKENYEKGIKVITYPAHRILPQVKNSNYIMGVVALKQAQKNKAYEALYIDDCEDERKRIYEATGSNFFALVDGALVTTKDDVLLGTTRALVLQLVNKLGMKVEEREVFLSEIPRFKESFITGTIKEIMPVVQIDDHIISHGKPGPITQKLMKKFSALTSTL